MNALISGYEATFTLEGTLYKATLRNGYRGINIPANAYLDTEGTLVVTCMGSKIPVLSVTELKE